jgi:arabinofuranosyltransferase
MGYYGALVANTAIAKEGMRLRWQRGWRYLVDFVRVYWFAIPVALMFAGGYVPLARGFRGGQRQRASWVLGAFLAAATLNALYIVGVGGDYLHARLLLPAVFALCAPIAVVPATRRHLVALGLLPWLAAAAFILRPGRSRVGDFILPIAGQVTVEDAASHSVVKGGGGATVSRPVSGLFIQTGFGPIRRTDLPLAPALPNAVIAVPAIGASSYGVGNGVYVFDLLGLADPITARLETRRATRFVFTGHEKPLPRPWVAARLLPPDFVVDPDQLPDGGALRLIPDTRGAAFQDQVRWARAALQCPAIRRLTGSVSDPMSPSRFLHNVIDAFTNTRLRVSPDPETAYHQLCGDKPLARPAQPSGSHAQAAWTSPKAQASLPSDYRGTTNETAQLRSTARVRAPRITAVSGFI